MTDKKILKYKVVKEVDDKIWSWFTGWCKSNQVKVGAKLSEILKDFRRFQ